MRKSEKKLIQALANNLECSFFRAQTELAATKWLTIQLRTTAEMYAAGELTLADVGEKLIAITVTPEKVKRKEGEPISELFLRWTEYASHIELIPCPCPQCREARGETQKNNELH